MDEMVRQAMSKWPNVPHCYGGLRLDARGQWRMRDERAQTLGLPGDPIRHVALLEFINRNYGHDEQGRWYFQNGPQRVYVDLEIAPYIAHLHPNADGVASLVLQTGQALNAPETAWMDGEGRLYLRQESIVAAVDDRDMLALLPSLHINGLSGETLDQALLQWLDGDDSQTPTLHLPDQTMPLQRLVGDATQCFDFVSLPRGAPD